VNNIFGSSSAYNFSMLNLSRCSDDDPILHNRWLGPCNFPLKRKISEHISFFFSFMRYNLISHMASLHDRDFIYNGRVRNSLEGWYNTILPDVGLGVWGLGVCGVGGSGPRVGRVPPPPPVTLQNPHVFLQCCLRYVRHCDCEHSFL